MSAAYADVSALVIPVDPEKPLRRITVVWDQAMRDDCLEDSEVFIDEVLRQIDHQKRFQLDSCTGPIGTRVWWVPQLYWAPGVRQVNRRAEWLLGEGAIDVVRSDFVVTGSGGRTDWPASLSDAMTALIEAGAR